MNTKLQAWKKVMESLEVQHLAIEIHNEVLAKMTGRPNWTKESNGLAQVDSFRNYENNVINSYNR